MLCKNWKCKKEIPDGTKKCPHCGWEDRSGSRTAKKEEPQPTITLHVSSPLIQSDGSFKIFAYAIIRKANGNLIEDGHRVFFHTDDMDEKADDTGDSYGQKGRADIDFVIPASRAGETITITAHTQTGDKRVEATKPIPLPRKKEERIGHHSLTVTPLGKDGKYSFDIWVADENGKGLISPVRVAENGISKGPFLTDESGYYRHPADAFSEKEREFLIQAGPRLVYKAILKGKRVKKAAQRKPVKILKGQGFLANFMNVMKNDKK